LQSLRQLISKAPRANIIIAVRFSCKKARGGWHFNLLSTAGS